LKELSGYIDRKKKQPGPESLPLPSETTIQYISTPIYLTTPTLDEWIFYNQLVRGHITLNCTDVAGLSVVMNGTAKEAWDSIQEEWGKNTDMRQSHAQEALNKTTYTEGNNIQGHIKLL
jgi:gag-polypeptide of LTR copia-type